MVELQIAAMKIPAGAIAAAVIPTGYRPRQLVYGLCTVRDGATVRIVEVIIRQSGGIEFRGNEATDIIRGTIAWVTDNRGPVR